MTFRLWRCFLSVVGASKIHKTENRREKAQYCWWDQIWPIYWEERASKVVLFRVRCGLVNPVGHECHQSKWEICIRPALLLINLPLAFMFLLVYQIK